MGIFSRLTGGGDSAPSSSTSTPDPAPAVTPVRSACPAAAPTPAGRERTVIAGGSKIVGDVVGSTELYVEGRVEGQIRVQHRVEIGPTGEVRGQIKAQSLRIGGKVYGNVSGQEKVEVLTTGLLEGDVHSPKLSISEGGFFKGSVDMSEVVDKSKPKTNEPAQSGDKPHPQGLAEAQKSDETKAGALAAATGPASAVSPGGKSGQPGNPPGAGGGQANLNKGRNGK